MTLVIDRTHLTNPNVFNDRPDGPDGVIAAIVLHHTAGTDSLVWLSGGHGVSTHKLFAKSGTIYKLVAESKRAWHAGTSDYLGREDWNDFSLGYEIECLGDGVDLYTPEQYESVAQSIAYDCALYHIGDAWVVRHAVIATPAGRKTDTDPTFNLDRLWARVAEIRAAWPYHIAKWECNK